MQLLGWYLCQHMIPDLHKVLYGDIDHIPRTKGRKFSDMGYQDPSFVNGLLVDRVTAFLVSAEVATATEIAAAVDTSLGKVRVTLNKLTESGAIDVITIDGCVTEYTLKKKL